MRHVISVIASLGALLLFAASAAAAPQGDPVRLWSVNKVEHGTGVVPVTGGAQVGGELFEKARTGGIVFNLPLPEPYWSGLPRDDAFGSVFSSANGAQYSVLSQAPTPNPLRIGAPTGTITHLDEYQAYEKRADDASLRLTISGVLAQTVDDNNDVAAWECCEPIRAVVRFHARAYAASAGGDFFTAGGSAYLVGHQHAWRPGAATSSDSARPLWGEDQFDVNGDEDDSGTGAEALMFLKKPRSLRIPLDNIRPGELFAVHVSLEAEAVNDRGGESAAQAAIQDPQHLFQAHGLKRRGKPHFKEPHAKPVQPARCVTRPRHAGVMQLSAPTFTANEAERAPLVLVNRSGGSHGSASVTVTARAGTAQAGHDFKATRTTVRFVAGETGARLVEIPLREDAQAEPPETFTVSLGHAKCGALGARDRATVTIVDDDQLPPPPPPPAAEFTVGGTVDGLTGSGLVLTSFGTDLPVSASGHFTLPGTRPAGTGYDVQVRTQPHSPDQVCTVEHGSGTIAADVTDVAVHCVTTPTLDGVLRVSTPVGGGHGEAVVIQPGGGIVTAGWRGTDFALTRHDDTGTPDQSFGDRGIATSDLGSADDEAYDAALTPDGGIVAVGRTAGTGLTDFGVARFGPNGEPGQIVKTDILGGGDQANAVAVQPDGKVVVAGYATRNGIDGDFALVRYNADGTRDHDFGTDGIVTTDLGTRSDDARALVLKPDGTIVVAGTADEDMALARYTATGDFLGTTITHLAAEAVATGVALTPDGAIVVAGYTVGPHANRDFLLARYAADGTFDRSVTTDVGGGDDFAENLVVDGAGRIVLVGRATSATILDMALVRYRADLTPDPGFDGDGILTADFHGRGEFGQDVAVDGSGRLVAAGYTANGADTEFALLRVNG